MVLERQKENWVATARDTVKLALPQWDVVVLNIDLYFEERDTSKVQLMYRYQLLIGSGQGECRVMMSVFGRERIWEMVDANHSMDPSRSPYHLNPRPPCAKSGWDLARRYLRQHKPLFSS